MEHVKYLHILWQNDLKFNPRLVRMINEQPDYFDPAEHRFLTPHPAVRDALAQYENVELVPDGNLIRRYSADCDWMFVHALNISKKELLLTPAQNLHKVIWRTWGHDIRPADRREGHPAYNLLHRLGWALFARKLRQVHAIGVENDIDVQNVENILGSMPTCRISYGYNPGALPMLREARARMCPHAEYRILVGHNGSPEDGHLEALEKLRAFAGENIRICMVMAYSRDEAYIRRVKETAKAWFGDKTEYVESFMPYSSYVDYIAGMDAAILNQKFSGALGNLSLLLYLDKKVYVDPESDLARSFCRQGCGVNSTADIPQMPFADFCRADPEQAEKLKRLYCGIREPQEDCALFRRVLDGLCL